MSSRCCGDTEQGCSIHSGAVCEMGPWGRTRGADEASALRRAIELKSPPLGEHGRARVAEVEGVGW